MFAIYVSYYVKVKLTLSGMGGELSLKLPFTLAHFDGMAGLSQQDSTATEGDPTDNGSDSVSVPTTEQQKSPLIVAEGENHTNTNTNLSNHHLPSCSLSSSSSSALATSAMKHSPSTAIGSKGQVTSDSEEEEDDLPAVPPPMSSVLRQRRFSQARQEQIRTDNSLDRIETLSDDGEANLETHEMAIHQDNNGTGLADKERGVAFHQERKPERKLTGSSDSLEETDLLDEVFCDSQTTRELPVQQPQRKTSSSVSTYSGWSVVKGESGEGPFVDTPQEEQHQQPRQPQEKQVNAPQAEEEQLKSTTLVQIHAPHS